MARTHDVIVWCNRCWSEPAGPGGRCSACSPPLPRCLNCGAKVWKSPFCSPACEVALAAEYAAGDLRYQEALASQAVTDQIDAAAKAEATANRCGRDF